MFMPQLAGIAAVKGMCKKLRDEYGLEWTEDGKLVGASAKTNETLIN